MANLPDNTQDDNISSAYDSFKQDIQVSGVPLWVYYTYYAPKLNGDIANMFNESYPADEDDDYYDEFYQYGL